MANVDRRGRPRGGGCPGGACALTYWLMYCTMSRSFSTQPSVMRKIKGRPRACCSTLSAACSGAMMSVRPRASTALAIHDVAAPVLSGVAAIRLGLNHICSWSNATTANSSCGVSVVRPHDTAALAKFMGSPSMEPDLSRMKTTDLLYGCVYSGAGGATVSTNVPRGSYCGAPAAPGGFTFRLMNMSSPHIWYPPMKSLAGDEGPGSSSSTCVPGALCPSFTPCPDGTVCLTGTGDPVLMVICTRTTCDAVLPGTTAMGGTVVGSVARYAPCWNSSGSKYDSRTRYMSPGCPGRGMARRNSSGSSPACAPSSRLPMLAPALAAAADTAGLNPPFTTSSTGTTAVAYTESRTRFSTVTSRMVVCVLLGSTTSNAVAGHSLGK
mmetsp:Transcript_34803/g.88170  ORF Transcript_34803/g.88170 Transcript_34803/m.88170 type:complete len:381 (+) Transcript_34803:1176-2318(+)